MYGSDAEEEEEEYNEYEGITGEGYDGPSEVSGSSSHGSRPPPSEPSVHGEGWSDFDSPSPGPPSRPSAAVNASARGSTHQMTRIVRRTDPPICLSVTSLSRLPARCQSFE